MVLLQFILIIMMLTNPIVLTFSVETNANSWRVVDDVVMGGRSQGNFSINQEGFAVFSGAVSVENNGGFSSIRHRFATKDMEGVSKAVLLLKGDGKKYQFRVKTKTYDRHSYIAHFETTGELQEIEIELAEMYPSYIGWKLDIPNYSSEQMEEIAFLISNKKAEEFRLEIHKIHFR